VRDAPAARTGPVESDPFKDVEPKRYRPNEVDPSVQQLRGGRGVPQEPAGLELALADERLRVDHEPRLARCAQDVPSVEVLVHEKG